MLQIPFEIVGFDLDGTLLDTHGDLGEALNHALRKGGREPVAMDEVRDLIGGGGRRMLERALERDGGPSDEATINALHRDLLAHYEENIAVHSRLFPGGAEALDALAAEGIKLAVVTNKLERLALRLLDELDLSHRFATVLGGDSLGPGKAKPAPDLLHEMEARCGGGRAAFVGDTTYDTRAARAAGLPSIALDFGYNDMAPADLGADAVISHYDELAAALSALV
ncbi:MAG: HAD-IA family hydrolase [Novosphingobium sp.]|nr:HAD-IA family hydrolase [Novosphingobium sp.]